MFPGSAITSLSSAPQNALIYSVLKLLHTSKTNSMITFQNVNKVIHQVCIIIKRLVLGRRSTVWVTSRYVGSQFLSHAKAELVNALQKAMGHYIHKVG